MLIQHGGSRLNVKIYLGLRYSILWARGLKRVSIMHGHRTTSLILNAPSVCVFIYVKISMTSVNTA